MYRFGSVELDRHGFAVFGILGIVILTACSKDPVSPKGPSAPSELVAMASSITSIRLNWTDNSADEQGFLIERSLSSEGFIQIAEVEPDVTTYTDTGLEFSRTYFYRVRAYNIEGNSDYTGTVDAVIKSGTLVGEIAVNFLAKDQNNSTVTLSSFNGKVILLTFGANG